MEWIVESESLSDFADGWFTVSGKQLVRCKDCQYCVNPFLFGKQYYQCEKRFESYGIDIFVEPDDYCSYGERKNES